jgi:hypothetical protein
MESTRLLGAVAPFVAVLAFAACGDSVSDADREAERVATESAAGRREYADDLAWLDRVYGACQEEIARTGECVVAWKEQPGTRPTSIVLRGEIGPMDWRANARAFSEAVALVARRGVCSLVAPLADAQNPTFFAGLSVGGGVVGGVTGSAEAKYDLRNRRAVVNVGGGATIGSNIGVGGSAYAGIEFGRCNDPNKKSDGIQCSVQGSVGLFGALSVEASVFTSNDGCTQGATLGLGVGTPTELPINGGIALTRSGAWDTGTEALGSLGWGGRSIQGPPGDKYVQFDSASQMALHLVSTMGVNGILPAAMAMALEQLDRRGLTIEQMCPNEVANQRQAKERLFSTLCPLTATPPPATPGGPTQGGTGNTPNPTPVAPAPPPPIGPVNPPQPAQPANPGPSGDAGADAFPTKPTDCLDKTDGWYCYHSGPGIMVLCQNTLITKGCVCAGCTTGGTPAPCACPY